MQADRQAIQGLWRIVSTVARGQPSSSAGTHYHFDGHRVKEVVPSLAEGGSWAVFDLSADGSPKRITMTYEFPARGGGTRRQLHRGLYELSGDTLRICWPLMNDEFPPEFSEQTQQVVSFERDHGPPPATKRRSLKASIKHKTLGTLAWDDDLDWWAGEVRFKGAPVELHIDPGTRGDEVAVASAAELVKWVKQNDAAARRCAARWLLETYNGFWNEGNDIAPRTFAARLTLDAISVRGSGAVDLYYADGGLFRGHSITVRVNEKRVFERAQLSG